MTVLGYDVEKDIAALQLRISDAQPLETDTSEMLKVGDRVVAIGAPLGLESTVSDGIVSGLRNRQGLHIIQTTASISPGSSGGPLLSEYGKVIGIATASVESGQALNFAVSITYVTELMNRKVAISLEEMRRNTLVTESMPVNAVHVRSGALVRLPFVVPMQQGATLAGTLSITGGRGNDANIALLTADGRVISNMGRVSSVAAVHEKLPRGQYYFNIDNQFSTFSSKSVLPNLRLIYYR
jgi:S1-C subfamily serine protease